VLIIVVIWISSEVATNVSVHNKSFQAVS